MHRGEGREKGEERSDRYSYKPRNPEDAGNARAWNSFCAEPLKRKQPCPHVDFRLWPLDR